MTYTGMLPFYGTDDLEATVKFYRDVMGFEIARDQKT